jgi:hypothetical protein
MGHSDHPRTWKPVAEPYPEPPAADPPEPAKEPPPHYEALEDPLFPGIWRCEPTPYVGRGFVYLFHGRTAQSRARLWAKTKNLQQKVREAAEQQLRTNR